MDVTELNVSCPYIKNSHFKGVNEGAIILTGRH